MQYLGIDIGTSFVKGALLDVDGLSLGDVRRAPAPPPLPDTTGMRHEVDPQQFVHTVQEIIEGLLATTDSCDGIVMCGQMGGLVLTDDRGAPLSNYISWLDRRAMQPHPAGGTYFEQLSKKVGSEWPAKLGNEFRPGIPLSFLFWLEQNGQLPDQATPVTLPDYVAAKICATTPVTEWTNATASIDVTHRNWPRALMERLRFGRLVWPPLVDFRHQVGHCFGTAKEIPVYAAVGDHQCALTGTFLQPGELSINISTGSQVAMISKDTGLGAYQQRLFFDRQYLKTVTHIPGGRSLSALMKLLAEIATAQGTAIEDAWDYAYAQAEAVTQSDLQMNLAFFPSAIEGPGQLGNLHEGNMTVGHLFHSALRQMAEYFDLLATRLSPQREWTGLVFSGGVAQRSCLLREMICDRLGSAHRLTQSSEDTMLGLLVLARVIAGRNLTVQDACKEAARWVR